MVDKVIGENWRVVQESNVNGQVYRKRADGGWLLVAQWHCDVVLRIWYDYADVEDCTGIVKEALEGDEA